jgi:hypothetical protein
MPDAYELIFLILLAVTFISSDIRTVTLPLLLLISPFLFSYRQTS